MCLATANVVSCQRLPALPDSVVVAAAPAAAGEEAVEKPPVDETADKLDSMMELTFAHLQRRHEAGQLGAAWDTLLAAFERCVLLTHRSKFTQVVPALRCAALAVRCCCATLAGDISARLVCEVVLTRPGS